MTETIYAVRRQPNGAIYCAGDGYSEEEAREETEFLNEHYGDYGEHETVKIELEVVDSE